MSKDFNFNTTLEQDNFKQISVIDNAEKEKIQQKYSMTEQDQLQLIVNLENLALMVTFRN